MPDLRDVSLIVKTFERQHALERFLHSVRKQGYGNCPVLIADDSSEPYRDAILESFGDVVDEYIILPNDCGLSRGRNELLRRVETPYFVLNDDDFVYDERTDLSWLKQELISNNLDVLGAILYEPDDTFPGKLVNLLPSWVGTAEKTKNFAGFLVEREDTIVLDRDLDYHPPHTRCDFVLNFFIADTEAIRSKTNGWNEDLKLGEHWEFFYRAKQGGLKVATTESVGIIHTCEQSVNYDNYRGRIYRYRTLGLETHGFKAMIFKENGIEDIVHHVDRNSHD